MKGVKGAEGVKGSPNRLDEAAPLRFASRVKTETILLILGAAYFLTRAKSAQAAPASQPVTATPGANPGEVILSIGDRIWGIVGGFLPSEDTSAPAGNAATNYTNGAAWPPNIA